jgi:hypothetical protein
MKISTDANTKLKQISFLPEPAFNPTFPTPNTLPAKALSFMLNGKALNHPDFEQVTGSWRLAAVIFTLKELGWPVESYEIAAPTLETPARHISRYFLPQKVIKAVFGEVHHD